MKNRRADFQQKIRPFPYFVLCHTDFRLLYFFHKRPSPLVLFGLEVFPLGLYLSVHLQFGVAFCKYKT